MGRGSGARRDRSPRAIFSGYDATQRVQPLAGHPGTAGARLRRALRDALGLRSLAKRQRRGVRPQGRGAFTPLVAAAEHETECPRPAELQSRPWRHERGRLAARPRVSHRDCVSGLPAEPQRDRQGRDRRTGLRRRPAARRACTGSCSISAATCASAARCRALSESPLPGPIRNRRADRAGRGQGPRRRHQRQLPARVSDRRQVVFAYPRSPDRDARRPGGRRDGHRAAVGRRRRPGHDLQRARARGEPAAGPSRARRRMPDRRRRRADRPERRLAPLRGDRRDARSRWPGEEPSTAAKPESPRPASCRRLLAGTRTSSCVVNFEINRPDGQGRRYRRPYVAVWVENKDGLPGPQPHALGLDGRRRAVPVAARPEALVSGRPGTQAGRDEGPVLHDRPADPAAGQVQGHLGRQGRPRQARPSRRIHDLHRRRPRARDLSEHPQEVDSGATSRSPRSSRETSRSRRPRSSIAARARPKPSH